MKNKLQYVLLILVLLGIQAVWHFIEAMTGKGFLNLFPNFATYSWFYVGYYLFGIMLVIMAFKEKERNENK